MNKGQMCLPILRKRRWAVATKSTLKMALGRELLWRTHNILILIYMTTHRFFKSRPSIILVGYSRLTWKTCWYFEYLLCLRMAFFWIRGGLRFVILIGMGLNWFSDASIEGLPLLESTNWGLHGWRFVILIGMPSVEGRALLESSKWRSLGKVLQLTSGGTTGWRSAYGELPLPCT
jgi:hypothetical protein